MKYRTKSADVLSEADRAQRVLEWRLFQLEQEAILYNPINPDGWDKTSPEVWQPGVPLYSRPHVIGHDDEGFAIIQGNCISPMIMTYEYIDAEEVWGEGELSPFQWASRCERIAMWPVVGCEPCGVGWSKRDDGYICWMCGADYTPEPSPFDFKTIGHIEGVTMTINGVEIRGQVDFSPVIGSMRRVGEAAQRAAPAFRQMAAHYHAVMQEFVVTDEQFRLITGFNRQLDAYSIGYDMDRNAHVVPYIPPANTNPFRVEEREIELVPRVYAEPLPPAVRRARRFGRLPITFASGWERQLYRPIASDERYLPRRRDLDRQRQHTQVHQSAWPGVEIVTERRRE